MGYNYRYAYQVLRKSVMHSKATVRHALNRQTDFVIWSNEVERQEGSETDMKPVQQQKIKYISRVTPLESLHK